MCPNVSVSLLQMSEVGESSNIVYLELQVEFVWGFCSIAAYEFLWCCKQGYFDFGSNRIQWFPKGMFWWWASLGEGCSSLWFSQFMSTKNVMSLKSCKSWKFALNMWDKSWGNDNLYILTMHWCVFTVRYSMLIIVFNWFKCFMLMQNTMSIIFKLMLLKNCCLTIICLMIAFSCLLQRSASGDPLQTKYPWVACSSCHSLTWDLVLFLLILFCS